MPLFAITVLASSALLFLVEPMFARMLLPRIGGAAAVWSTCIVFFQAALLAAYAYAYAAPDRLGEKRHAKLHLVVLLLPALCLPLAVHGGDPPSGENPTRWLLGALTISVGLPFFALATTTPLMSRWYAAVAPGKDAYLLYASSNIGSLAALLAYPFVVEPLLSLRAQSIAFAIAYASFACVAAIAAARRIRATPIAPPVATPENAAHASPTWQTMLRWTALAFVPSSLMLGATTYIATDIASAPLVWVPPLALYLLSFVIVFRSGAEPRWRRVLAPTYVGLAASLFLFSLVPLSQHIVVGVLHVLLVFVAGLVFHGELSRRRPDERSITSFYLCIALGGAIGGLVSAILAPLVFRRVLEYPLVMAAAIALVPREPAPPSESEREAAFLRSLGIDPPEAPKREPPRPPRILTPIDVLVAITVTALAIGLFHVDLEGMRGTFAKYAIPVALCVVLSIGRRERLALGLVAITLASRFDVAILHEERSFFGVIRVEDRDGLRSFFHGTTIHGRQSLDPSRRREPLDYYDRDGPVGALFASLPRAPRRAGVIGLGTGAIAAYSIPGARWTFYEIDANVERVARGYFTFLADAPATVNVVLGDGRLEIARADDAEFDLLVIDAFSSDAIPTHLITREALALYMRKLAPGGALVFHITNRYVRLERVVAALARDAALEARLGSISRAEAKNGVPGTWVALAREVDSLGALATRWRTLREAPGRVWTDDHTNLLGALGR